MTRYLGVHGVVVLLRPNPATHQLVANGVRGRLVEIVLGRHVAVLHQRVVEVAVEGALNSIHVLQLWDVPHGDLLLAVAGARRSSHGRSRNSF